LLVCPATSEDDVDKLLRVFKQCLATLSTA